MNDPPLFDPNRFSLGILSPMNQEWANLFGANLAVIDPWLRLQYSATGLMRYFLEHNSERLSWVVLKEDTPRACLSVRPYWLRGPLLELLAVLPPHQNQGVAKAIILWLVAECRRRNQANLWTISSEFNQPARNFYQRLGFEEAGVLPDLINSGETELLLRLRLP